MKLVYIANVRMPTEKAHGLQIMKMCESFACQGAEVELIVPWRFNPFKEDPFDFYGVKKNFKITKVPSFDLINAFGRIGFWLQSLSFSKFAQIYAIFRRSDIIYSRDALPLFWLSFYKKNIFWETHAGVFNFIVKRVIKKCAGIIAISQGLKDFYVKKGADADKILVVPDAVDLEEFDIKISKSGAREKLGLPQDKKLIGYSGMLRTMGMEKGIDIAIESLKFLDKNAALVLVGGRDEDIEFYRKEAEESGLTERVLFVGQIKHQEVPLYLKAFDVLIAPFPENEHYKFYMSPLKIFEYMASGAPIVASDLPSIREILNNDNAVLVKPGDPATLAEGIKKVLQNQSFADRISSNAYSDVREYTWEKRAETILKFLCQN